MSADVNHPLFTLMRDLIAATYGLVPVLRDLFDGVDGVELLLIYGSWAARRAGESGAFPKDVDVLVVGDTPRRKLAAFAAKAGGVLDLPVNVARIALSDWDADDPSPFVSTIRSRPVVDVTSGEILV